MTGVHQAKGGNDALGYRHPAGDLVTQATDKSTAVTINALCGEITTDGAALGAATEVTFVVNNNLVEENDVPVVAIQAGGTAGEYAAFVTDVGDGVFSITLTNLTVGSLSDAIVINFVVLKAVQE